MPYKVLQLVTLVVSDVNCLVSGRVAHLLFICSSLPLVQHAVGRHHSGPTNLGYSADVAVTFVVLPLSHCGRRDNALDRLIPTVVVQSVEVLVSLRSLLDRTQWCEVVGARVATWILRLVHHLLRGLVLATCAASYVVFALIVVDGSEVLWTCHSARTLSCSGKAASLTHVSLVCCRLGRWVQA